MSSYPTPIVQGAVIGHQSKPTNQYYYPQQQQAT